MDDDVSFGGVTVPHSSSPPPDLVRQVTSSILVGRAQVCGPIYGFRVLGCPT